MLSIYTNEEFGIDKSVEVSSFQGSPYKGVPL